MPDTAQIIINRIIKKGTNIETIAGRLGYSVDAVRMWRRGLRNPKTPVIKLLKEIENVKITR